MVRRSGDGSTDTTGDVHRVGVAAITTSGPEEPPKPVLEAAGDNVHVDVGDALAHLVVHGHEGAVGTHGFRHRGGDPLHRGKQRMQGVDGEVDQGLVMRPGDDQDMSGEERPKVQEAEDLLFVQHHVGRPIPPGDVAEIAVRDHALSDHRVGGQRPCGGEPTIHQ